MKSNPMAVRAWCFALVTVAVTGAAAAGGCSGTPEPAARKARPARIAALPKAPFVDLDGAEHDPLDVRGAEAHVLIFITTDCPIANTYAPEIRSIVADFQGEPLRFYLVHVDPTITKDAAREHAESFGYTCPVLVDPGHELVRATGVEITPEAAVITAGGALAYRGRIDNWYGDLGAKRPQPTRRELRDALDAVLEGRPVAVARTEAVGCFIPERE